jgi:hypothetical protein
MGRPRNPNKTTVLNYGKLAKAYQAVCEELAACKRELELTREINFLLLAKLKKAD